MKELYLTTAQIERLAKGGEVLISRKGRDILVSSKKALMARTDNSKQVQKLEREIARLKAKGAATPPHECDICHKKFWKPEQHKALAHNGRKSNLPHLKQRS